MRKGFPRRSLLSPQRPDAVSAAAARLPAGHHAADDADEQGSRGRSSADLSTVLPASWPGNVRQLKNAVYRALTQLEGFELRPQDILLPDHDVASLPVGEEAMEGSLDDITRRFERSVLTQLYRSYPSTRKLAKRLGCRIPPSPSCVNMV